MRASSCKDSDSRRSPRFGSTKCHALGRKLFTADVNSACLQAEDMRAGHLDLRAAGEGGAGKSEEAHGTTGRPGTCERRSCRATRRTSRYETRSSSCISWTDASTCPTGWRPTKRSEHKERMGFESAGQRDVLDGIIGLHVGDFVSGGECVRQGRQESGIHGRAVEEVDSFKRDPECWRDHTRSGSRTSIASKSSVAWSLCR